MCVEISEDRLISLPWNFEAFRRFLTFSTIQQAAATLVQFDNTQLLTDPRLMEEFTRLLYSKTGLERMPRRTASEGVLFNIEGNVFRNKARVFTSLYLIDSLQLKSNDLVVLTPFGRALGCGYIEETQFFREIINRYEYPHPAYDDNWDAWTDVGLRLKPLAFILKILIDLHRIDEVGEVSVSELAAHAHPKPYHNRTAEIAQEIVDARESSAAGSRKRSDRVDRKIGDMLGFLCITSWSYYHGKQVGPNLMSTHQEESSTFWGIRLGQDTAEEMSSFLDSALGVESD